MATCISTWGRYDAVHQFLTHISRSWTNLDNLWLRLWQKVNIYQMSMISTNLLDFFIVSDILNINGVVPGQSSNIYHVTNMKCVWSSCWLYQNMYGNLYGFLPKMIHWALNGYKQDQGRVIKIARSRSRDQDQGYKIKTTWSRTRFLGSTNTFIIYLIDDYHTNCIE